MTKKHSRFESWKKRSPKHTKELADLLEDKLTIKCENAGFTRSYFWLGDISDYVRGDEIQFERSVNELTDIIYVNFDKYGASRFQIGFARRNHSYPHDFVRSGNLVSNTREYLHFWGKPWWRPIWSWSQIDNHNLVENVISKLDQIFLFLESGAVGSNIRERVIGR